jgi:CBS domain-containing protein
MNVGKHMSAPVVTVRADADYRTAFDLMRDKAVHHLPVLDAQGKLVGLVAQRDMLVAATRYQNAPVEMAEVMHRPVITTKADVPVVEAARMMMSQKIGCLPVVDADLNLLGVITESDLFEVFVRRLSSGAGAGRRASGAPAARRPGAAKAPARKPLAKKRAKRKTAARKR